MKYHFLQVIVNCPLAMLPHICLLSWFVLCGRNTSVLWRNMSTSYCLGMKQFPSWIPHAPWHSYPITLPHPSCWSPLLLKVFMACVFFLPTQRRVPVKWTAPEALESQLFSYKSDIWSFGVVLWEIFSYGHSPYPDFKISASWEPFIHYLKEGNRLPCPDGCPDPLYDLMLQCWGLRPDERPSAKDLVTVLTPQSDGTDSLHSQQSFNSQETTV